jgi:hypothetical protein
MRECVELVDPLPPVDRDRAYYRMPIACPLVKRTGHSTHGVALHPHR